MNQNAGIFDNNADVTFGSYRDVTGANASNNMTSTLFTQNPTLFRPIPPASSSHSPLIQPSLTVFDTSAFVDGPPGHAAISICPREWWQERQPERTPLREEDWPNRLFSSSPPLQSVPDFAPGSAPQLYQAPNQTDLLNLQDTLQLPPPMTVQHPHAPGVLLPVNQKLYQATCGANPIVQVQILKEFVRLENHMGQRRELAIPDDPNSAFWRCAIPGCSQKPQRQWDLAAHYLKHMEGIQKPWACVGNCGKLYARNGDLRRHQRTCRVFQSNSDEPIPIPSADAGPNGLPIGSSHQANASGSQHMLAPNSTSTYNPVHFAPHSPTQMAGTSNGVTNGVYDPYPGHQTGWGALQSNNIHGYYAAPTPAPLPRHTRNGSNASNTSSNASAYGARNTGNNHNTSFDHDRNENVEKLVPIEVRRPVDMADLEVLEKGRGDQRYSPSEKLAHKSSSSSPSRHSSIRSTALALGTLFVVVSSLFGWQLYRTLSA